ncbi:hypothetical protein HDK77DRAFT_498247 [Phyllosticta capitalensis]
MIKIESLLNPLSEASLGRHSPPPSPHLSDPHRSKVSKTAAVFVKGEPKGEVRYPPHEVDDDDELVKELIKYRITPSPLRDIKKYPRHIPYNSDKKSFLTRTGREAFEVFQYTYKVPGESTEYVVMWDYNIGLVRITPFFKSCKYPKTTPAKALRINNGLGAISYSITGGALAAQGYWMPFEAAKAVAATFCYPIRHALTPIFGREFIEMCTLPTEASYASFKIRDDIVRDSTQQTEQWRSFYSTPQSDHAPSPTPLGSPLDIQRPSSAAVADSFPPWSPASSRQLRRVVTRSGGIHPQLQQQSSHCHDHHRSSKRRVIGSSRNINRHSDHTPTSDTDDERYTISPQVSPKGKTFLWFSADGAPYTPAPTPRARRAAAERAVRGDPMSIANVVTHNHDDNDVQNHGAACGSPVSTVSTTTATTATLGTGTGAGTPTSAASPQHNAWYSFVPRSCWSEVDEVAASDVAMMSMSKPTQSHQLGHYHGGIPTSHVKTSPCSPRLLPGTTPMPRAGAGSKRKVSESSSSATDDEIAAVTALMDGCVEDVSSPVSVISHRLPQHPVRPRGAIAAGTAGKGTDMEAALALIAMASGGEEDDVVDDVRRRKSRRVS